MVDMTLSTLSLGNHGAIVYSATAVILLSTVGVLGSSGNLIFSVHVSRAG